MSKSIGVVRKVDILGRVVLPKETRDTFDWAEGTPLEMYTEGESLILKKYQPGCVLCDGMDVVTKFKGKNVCQGCRKELKGG